MIGRGWQKYVLGVVFLHVAGIVFLSFAASRHPALVGVAVLAYTFGLRHAFDVDHIAFIDNTIRKFLQQGKNSNGVGFFFSLGHSTVVVLMVIATVSAMNSMRKYLPPFARTGAISGTLISGFFLLLLACLNLVIWFKLYQAFLQMRKRQTDDNDIENLLASRGLFAKLVRRFMKLITKSWHTYPIGFLFGLGFDTASEVALLAISATAEKNALPIMGILSLPIFFAAGMSLMDTADGLFMTSAYGWAFSTPLRKIYYNLSVTGLGVLAATVIGLLELAQVVTEETGLTDGIWGWIQGISFNIMGYVLVSLFVLVWAISFFSWKVLKIEERWE